MKMQKIETEDTREKIRKDDRRGEIEKTRKIKMRQSGKAEEGTQAGVDGGDADK